MRSESAGENTNVLVSSDEKQCVLVVDDDRMNRVLLTRILSHHGIASRECSSGKEATQLVASQSFALVLLDISMPDMDGFQTLQKIRLTHDKSELPVIMVTAASDRSDVVKAFSFGANDYLNKPISADITASRVKTHLSLVAARSALQESQQRLGK